MKYRKLGANGPEISVVGFGSWAIGGGGWDYSWGNEDDALSVASVHIALDLGITFFDTAPEYGLGHSEEIIGRALKGHRNKVILATKCGVVWDERRKTWTDGTYQSIMAEAEGSLRRLDTDYIDLYQVHWPDIDTGAAPEETMCALDHLVRDGKVRYVGVSNYDISRLEQSMSVRKIDSLQPSYSLLDRSVEHELLPYCMNHGIGVVAYSPLASGLLSGKYTEHTTFEEGDWRNQAQSHTGEGLRQSLQKVNRLREIADSLGISVPQLAVAFVLANPAVTSAIVGARKPMYISSIVAAVDVSIDPNMMAELCRL